MGGWLNMLMGLTPGATQAAALPNTQSLAYLAANPPQAAASQGSGATNPFTANPIGTGSGQSAPTGASGGAGAGGAVGGVGSQGTGAQGFTAAQTSAYRTGVENALNSIYGNVAGKVQGVEGPLYGGPTGAEGGAEILNMGQPGQAPAAGAPALSAEQMALLGPGISSGFPWGPGISNVPGSNVSGPRQLLQSIMAGEQGTQQGFVPTYGQELPQQVAALGQSPWFIPGTAPQTFFPANVFGDVTGSAQGIGGASTAGTQPAPVMGSAPSWLNTRPTTPYAPIYAGGG